jgi:DNA-3-methyladenine glycosylase I
VSQWIGKTSQHDRRHRRAHRAYTDDKQVTRCVWCRAIITSPESIALSKDLRKRGWSFVGPTTMCAFMQALGLINDRIQGCAARTKALQARSDFRSPVVAITGVQTPR